MAGAPTLRTGMSTFWPCAFAQGRRGRLYFVNGIDRGGAWLDTAAASVELGMDAPLAAATAALSAGGAATAGDYLLVYRYVDAYGVPSSVSADLTKTASANQQFVWTIVASTHTRVATVELYRSTSAEADVVYLIATQGNNGTITSGTTNGGPGKVRFTLPTGHNLIVGSKFLAAGLNVAGYNTTHTVSAVTATTVDTDINYTADCTTGTWTINGFANDKSSDATIALLTTLPINTTTGELEARRFTPPPDFTPFVEQFQDRTWYFGAVKYTAGTVSTTSGSTTISGSSTNWVSNFAGRYLYIVGHPAPLIISAANASSITSTVAATATLTGAAYCILPDPAYRDQLFFSEVDEPESVPITNVVPLQNNTGDDDDITGGHTYGTRMFITKERHLYSMTFIRQPDIDASPHLMAARGAFNNRCFLFYGDTAYVMDAQGPYRVNGEGVDEHFADPVQNVFFDGSLDFSKTKWWHITVDYLRELVCFHVSYTGESYTRPQSALVFNGQTGEWTLDSYPLEIGAGCLGTIAGQPRRILGGTNDLVLCGDEGYTDIVTAVRGGCTPSFVTNDINDTTNSPFTAAMVGAPIALVDGPKKGQLRYITSVVSASRVMVNAAWSTFATTGDTYLVGAIQAIYRSGYFQFPRSDNYSKRSLRLVYLPTTNANVLFARIYKDHQSSPTNMQIADDAGLGISTAAGSTYARIDTQAARSAQGTQAGFGEFGLSGITDDRGTGQRFVSVEIVMHQGAEQLSLYELQLDGAGQ